MWEKSIPNVHTGERRFIAMTESSRTSQTELDPRRPLIAWLWMLLLMWLQLQMIAHESRTPQIVSRWSYPWFFVFILPCFFLLLAAVIAALTSAFNHPIQLLRVFRVTQNRWWFVVFLLAAVYLLLPGPPERVFAAIHVGVAYISIRLSCHGFRISRLVLMRWCTAGVALSLAVIVMECLIRSWAAGHPDPPIWARDTEALAAGEIGRYQPHHYQIYRLRPDFQRGGLTHNAHGFRGRELEMVKPDRTYRIVCVGGSTTYTEKVSQDDHTYPAQLERFLRARFAQVNIEVINAGVPGYTTAESLINLAFRVSEWDPDLIVIYHAVNDVRARFCHGFASDYAGYRKSWTHERHPFRRSIVVRLIAAHLGNLGDVGLSRVTRRPLPVDMASRSANLASSDPRYFKRNLELMTGMARQIGANVALSTFAVQEDRIDKLRGQGVVESNACLVELANTLQVPLLQLHQLMPQGDEYFFDPVHVNEAGARIKAELFAEFIAEQFADEIQKVRGESPSQPGGDSVPLASSSRLADPRVPSQD